MRIVTPALVLKMLANYTVFSSVAPRKTNASEFKVLCVSIRRFCLLCVGMRRFCLLCVGMRRSCLLCVGSCFGWVGGAVLVGAKRGFRVTNDVYP